MRVGINLTVRGLGFRDWGLGFGVWGLRFWVWGLGFGVEGLGFRVWGLGSGVEGLGLRVWGLGLRVAKKTRFQSSVLVRMKGPNPTWRFMVLVCPIITVLRTVLFRHLSGFMVGS